MSLLADVPPWIVYSALLGALVGVVYFLYTGLREDHETGEYHFTWGVGVVTLLLLGLVPGLVGVGLYLTVELGYPTYWFVAALLVALVTLSLLGAAVSTDAVATEVTTVYPA